MTTAQNNTWRIALGVFVGMVAATWFTRACDAFIAYQALNKAAHELHEQQKREATESEERLRAESMNEGIARDAAARRAGADAEAQAQARDANAQRELAWQRFYKPPKECDQPPTDAAFVECSNAQIQARRLFNQTYLPPASAPHASSVAK